LISRDKLREFSPRLLLSIYRIARSKVKGFLFYGKRYYCNVCSSSLRAWVNAGPASDKNLVCPVCNSYGRHRMMAIVISKEIIRDDTNDALRMLHFAPEIGFKNWLRREYPHLNYLSADLLSSEVDLRIDLQGIDLPSESIDFIILSHVLEHVENDTLALCELNRILSKGGKLFIQVPLSVNQKTIEDVLNTKEARQLRYGKTDHVRLYGLDLKKRLADAGFEVSIYDAFKNPYNNFLEYMALDLPDSSLMIYESESTTFVCRKLSN
jgi:SAM-dependent methyltransferase